MVGLLLAIALAGFSCVQTNLVKRNLPGILLGIYRCTILFFLKSDFFSAFSYLVHVVVECPHAKILS